MRMMKAGLRLETGQMGFRTPVRKEPAPGKLTRPITMVKVPRILGQRRRR